jgi:hypothetical protein
VTEFRRHSLSLLGVSRVVGWSSFSPSLIAPFSSFGPFNSLSSRDSSVIGMVETLLLAQSACFVGTHMSTFSDHVTQLMAAAPGRADAARSSARFYDQQTKLSPVPYEEKFRPDGFKLPMRMTAAAQQALQQWTAPLPRKNN